MSEPFLLPSFTCPYQLLSNPSINRHNFFSVGTLAVVVACVFFNFYALKFNVFQFLRFFALITCLLIVKFIKNSTKLNKLMN